jgi:hypothetical protein
MNPQYIKLTAVRVTMPPPTNGRGQPAGPAETKILQPPVVQLVPLPIAFNRGQVDGRAERNDSGVAVTYREQFDDVLEAIERAHRGGDAIAIPVDAVALAEATEAAIKDAMATGIGIVRVISPTVQEAVETAVNGVKAALDAEEAAKVDEKDALPERATDIAARAQNAPRWDDFVQTDGENVGEPKYKRRPRVGDLCIRTLCEGRYFIEQAYRHENDEEITWAAPNLPFPLLRTFDSRDQLIEEVAKAGRESQLVNA